MKVEQTQMCRPWFMLFGARFGVFRFLSKLKRRQEVDELGLGVGRTLGPRDVLRLEENESPEFN